MLGYLVGLGDRHGENILIDTESGRRNAHVQPGASSFLHLFHTIRVARFGLL